MLTARDIMTKEVITVSPDTEIVEAARLLLSNHLNGLPVVDENGKLAGIICQEDLVVQQKKIPLPSFFTVLDGLIPLKSQKSIEQEIEKISAATVKQAMTKNPVTIEPETEIEDIATLMVSKNIHTLPVLEKGKLAGIVGKEDVLRTIMPSG
ncbi:MAG: CBS domain-containing protein [Syntrophales bacterium]|nr:CBS domain-containing protein [Syntrophales bacterium]MDY0043574.1 CBS domain-containing protein [Syntrophales bacterium]